MSLECIYSFFQITENTELEFFETSARTGEGVTEVRRILSLETHTSNSVKIQFSTDLQHCSSIDTKHP